MHLYSSYGLCVSSELELPLSPALDFEVDVVVRQREIERYAPHFVHDGGDRVSGKVDGVLRFTVEEGRTVTVDPKRGADENLVRSIVTGIVFAIVLRQRGYLTLHASCVAKGGSAIGFLGDSGWGKSTTAEYFLQRGYRMVNDDILALEVTSDGIVVLPGSPHVRLRPDAGTWLNAGFDRLPQVHTLTDKRVRATGGNDLTERLTLSSVYVLEEEQAAENEILEMAPQDALVELVRHTRVSNVIRHPRFLREHLEQCSQLLKTVAVRRLKRVRRLESLPEIFSLVHSDADGRPLRLLEMSYVCTRDRQAS